MNRALCYGVLFLALSCQAPADRVPVRPLAEDTPPLPYAELLTRARLQATAATEAFYVNQWADLEEASKGLAQTAQFLGKAVEVPASRKESLPTDSKELTDEANRLREAAKSKDVKETNVVLQRIHLKVRQLRPEG